MTQADYLHARDLFIKGEKRLTDIASDYGVSINTIRVRSSREKWGKLRSEYAANRLSQSLGSSGPKPLEFAQEEPIQISIGPKWYAEQGEFYRRLGAKLLAQADKMLDDADNAALTPQERTALARAASTLVDQGREAIGFAKLAPVKSQPSEPKAIEAIPLDISS